MSEVYYKILIHKGVLTPVCMQWFDEHDYDQKKFLSTDNFPFLKVPAQFESEEAANEFIKQVVGGVAVLVNLMFGSMT